MTAWSNSRFEIAALLLQAAVVNYRAWNQREPASIAGQRMKRKRLAAMLWEIERLACRLRRTRSKLATKEDGR